MLEEEAAGLTAVVDGNLSGLLSPEAMERCRQRACCRCQPHQRGCGGRTAMSGAYQRRREAAREAAELFRVSLLVQGGPLTRPARAPTPRGRRPLLSPPRLPAAPLVRARNTTSVDCSGALPQAPALSPRGEESECSCGSVVVMGGRGRGRGPSPPGHRRRTRNPRGPPRPSASVTR